MVYRPCDSASSWLAAPQLACAVKHRVVLSPHSHVEPASCMASVGGRGEGLTACDCVIIRYALVHIFFHNNSVGSATIQPPSVLNEVTT